eukprot:2334953-Pyramimonas_sp.AAC.1
MARPADRARVHIGNATVRFSLPIISACKANQVGVIMENPASPLLWALPRLRKLCEAPASNQVTLDYCQHGATFGTGLACRAGTWEVSAGCAAFAAAAKDYVNGRDDIALC